MSQESVLTFLESHRNKSFCIKELQQYLDVNKHSLAMSLRKLCKQRLVYAEKRQVVCEGRSGFAWVKFFKLTGQVGA